MKPHQANAVSRAVLIVLLLLVVWFCRDVLPPLIFPEFFNPNPLLPTE